MPKVILGEELAENETDDFEDDSSTTTMDSREQLWPQEFEGSGSDSSGVEL